MSRKEYFAYKGGNLWKSKYRKKSETTMKISFSG